MNLTVTNHGETTLTFRESGGDGVFTLTRNEELECVRVALKNNDDPEGYKLYVTSMYGKVYIAAVPYVADLSIEPSKA